MNQGFLLSSAFGSGGLLFQGRLEDGRRFRWRVSRPRLCFFVERGAPDAPGAARKPLELRTLRGAEVDALYFGSQRDLLAARREYEALGVPAYEADVPAIARHLMERNIKGAVRFLDPPAGERDGLLEYLDPRVEAGDFTPRLRLLSFDVECSPENELFAIAVHGDGPDGRIFSRAWVVDPSEGGKPASYLPCRDEKSLMQAFFRAVAECDPDCLVGWNVVNFDLRWLAEKSRRLGISFDLGVDAGPGTARAEMVEPEGRAGRMGPQWLARVPGRAVLDGIAMLRAAFVEVDSYGLGAVAQEILGEKKLIELEGEAKIAEIKRRFREDKESLSQYNRVDAELAYRIFDKLSLSQLAVRKARLTGLSVDRMAGSNAALDFLYLPRLHRRGFVADTARAGEVPEEGVPGGLVLEGRPGFYRHVLVLDFKSLYPSLIRTFLIDPLAAAAAQGWAKNEPSLKGPAGPGFARAFSILPGIVAELAEERERAKREGDASLSQAVKIIMNSFYGVLGNPGCRFYHPDLAGAITRSGQWVLLESKRFLEAQGFAVLYGDTDSLFLHAAPAVPPGASPAEAFAAMRELGARLCADLNRHLQVTLRERYGAESRLSMEAEKIFLGFFLPSLRNEDRGSKKRYAGLLVKGGGEKMKSGGGGAAKGLPGQDSSTPGEVAAASAAVESGLHFTGMESARSDWTSLAKDFQAELLAAAFALENSSDRAPLDRLVREWKARLFSGALDDRLEYRKGLSKDLDEYSDSAPPHVRAARALESFDGRVIRYVMTVEGPEPVQKRSAARPDYRHYAEKQLAPVADMVLRFFGADFATVTGEGEQLRIL